MFLFYAVVTNPAHALDCDEITASLDKGIPAAVVRNMIIASNSESRLRDCVPAMQLDAAPRTTEATEAMSEERARELTAQLRMLNPDVQFGSYRGTLHGGSSGAYVSGPLNVSVVKADGSFELDLPASDPEVTVVINDGSGRVRAVRVRTNHPNLELDFES